ncbi:MAG: pyridoxamine 5'-phosphate oxidase family protein [Planctomycetota bacterium]
MAFDTDNLPEILDHLWRHLEAATRSAKPPFHLPTLCSVDAEGRPAARTVVLRRVDRDRRRLICHTDIRAEKFDQFSERPDAAWVFYDAPARIQLRATGPMTLHTDDALADEQWERSGLGSRRCYLAPVAPGSLADGPSPNLPEAVLEERITEAQSLPGRANFAVLSCSVDRFDWLYLHHAGHRRAEFRWPSVSNGQAAAASWLEP